MLPWVAIHCLGLWVAFSEGSRPFPANVHWRHWPRCHTFASSMAHNLSIAPWLSPACFLLRTLAPSFGPGVLGFPNPGSPVPPMGSTTLAPLDCVSVHATPVIDVYPRIPSPGSVQGFRLAPCKLPRAKVLRAGLAVIVRRVYGFFDHVVCLRRRGRGVVFATFCFPAGGSRRTGV